MRVWLETNSGDFRPAYLHREYHDCALVSYVAETWEGPRLKRWKLVRPDQIHTVR